MTAGGDVGRRDGRGRAGRHVGRAGEPDGPGRPAGSAAGPDGTSQPAGSAADPDGTGRPSAGGPASPDGRRARGRALERADGEFDLFVYGTLRSDGGASGVLEGCRLLGRATVEGTLYDLGEHPALMLYGVTPVEGEIWRCPAPLLWKLDEYEGVDRGLFRRVAVMAGDVPCWAYVAGPQLGQRLTPDRRLCEGRWAAKARPAG